jgi:hypothetical protein
MKTARTIISVLIFISVVGLALTIISKARDNQELKKDYAEINHFKYGLFSVQTWKTHLHEILLTEIDQFQLAPENERVIRKQMERQLSLLIDQMLIQIEKENTKTPGGFLKQSFIDSFIDVKQIKKGIPEYSRTILRELKSKKNQNELKGLIKTKIQDYVGRSFDVREEEDLKTGIIAKYSPSGKEAEARALIDKRVTQNQQLIRELSLYLIFLSVALFILEALNRDVTAQVQYLLMTATLLVLLSVGVTTPMIDMEAKIAELSFVLLDQPVTFKDQVIFFQSKSIVDVFWIMMRHPELEMRLVGILMICFSIIFPGLKTISSISYYYNFLGARKQKIVYFFAFKSGKWSMADVLIVAIFMSYIGLNGIINAQLLDIKTSSESVDIMTTNGTNLQPGFYIFLAYTLLAMLLSGFLKKSTKVESDNSTLFKGD